MSLIDILEIAGYSIAGITTALTGTIGAIQGKYYFENCEEFYNEIPKHIQQTIEKPNKSKIYFESIIAAPKFITRSFANKYFEDSFTKYIGKLGDKLGEDYLRNYVLSASIRNKSKKK